MASDPEPRRLKPATLCVHGGWQASPAQRSLVAPIVNSSTFLLDDEAYRLRREGRSDESLVYTRETNPTLEAVERKLAALEGAERALVYASGSAALHALLLTTLERGQHVLAPRDLYGGTLALFRELLPRLGVDVSYVELGDLGQWKRALRSETRMLYCESISNPTLAVADLPALAGLAQAQGALLAVDATFATPFVQRPLELGAEVALHSATKYFGGHTDLVGGVLCGKRELLHRCHGWRTRAGGCMDPFAAFLLDRGLKTLALRMQAHCNNALMLAHFLSAHPKVAEVHHPGLASHASNPVARRVLKAYGGMVSFVHAEGDEAAKAFMRRLKLFTEAASLGGVESLVSMPAILSHVSVPEDERRRMGIVPGYVRLSAGIEDDVDLIDDLMQALG